MSNDKEFSCVCGIDIAKNVMQVYEVTADGESSNRAVRRADFLRHFENKPATLIGMEACSASQHWARELQALGHTVKLMSPKAVKPYVKGMKNDRNDARGIYVALTIGVRSVPVKSPSVRDLALLQTMRAKRQRDKTRTINHVRGILAEYGLVMGRSVSAFLKNAGGLIAQLKEREDVSPFIVSELEEMLEEVENILLRISELEKDIQTLAKGNKNYDLFQKLPGVGPVTSAIMSVLLCDPTIYRNGRAFAAYLGLAPMSFGSGGKNQVTHIPSKYGCNKEVRAILVQCAQAIALSSNKSTWVSSILERKPKKVAIIAIANKLARQLWAMAIKGDKFEKRFVLGAV